MHHSEPQVPQWVYNAHDLLHLLCVVCHLMREGYVGGGYVSHALDEGFYGFVGDGEELTYGDSFEEVWRYVSIVPDKARASWYGW